MVFRVPPVSVCRPATVLGGLLAAFLCVVTFGSVQAHAQVAGKGKVTVALVGDSTVAEGGGGRGMHGWGEFVKASFLESVEVVDRAKAGASAKSYQREAHWKRVLEESPDFVLIQFGHNDALSKDSPASTEPDGEYREALVRYVETARKRKIRPVFVTPPHQRTFGADGKLNDILKPYVAVMRGVAAEMKVPLADLHERSRALYEALGPEKSRPLSVSATDPSHLSELGAKAMAELLVRELRVAAPELADHMRKGGTVLREAGR